MEDYRHAPETAPEAPRELTPEVSAAAESHGRFLRIFGRIWMVVGGAVSVMLAGLATRHHVPYPTFLMLGFVVVGAVTYFLGKRQHSAALALHRDGAVAEGEVVAVYVDRNTKLMNKHPWVVKYDYLADEQRMHGTARFWDGIQPRLEKGDVVEVLYGKDAPSKSILWMTVDPSHGKPEAEKPRARRRRRRRRVAVEEPTSGADDTAAAQEAEAEAEAQEAASGVAHRERSV